MNPTLHDRILESLFGAPADQRTIDLVDAACRGDDALEAALQPTGPESSSVSPSSATPPTPAAATARPATYLTSLTVEGFRGIAAPTTLDVTPGPGLTVIIGSNGSGKSSLAEGLETLLTGANLRWDGRPVAWKQGWRNLHHKGPTGLDATFTVEGHPTPLRLTRRWAADTADFAESTLSAPGGHTLDSLGWTEPLVDQRPFLSYNELGRLLDRPAILHDALAAILGLDDVTEATQRLATHRLTLDKRRKATNNEAKALAADLAGLDDPRARKAAELLPKRSPDLEALAAIGTGSASATDDAPRRDALRRLATLHVPSAGDFTGAAASIREALVERHALAATDGARQHAAAKLLEQALSYVHDHATPDCPVCGTSDALDPSWADRTRTSVAELREAATRIRDAERAVDAASRTARGLLDRLASVAGLATTAGLSDDLTALTALASAPAEAPALSDHLDAHAAPGLDATTALIDSATMALTTLDDLWRPFAQRLTTWLGTASQVRGADAALKDIKAAEAWLTSWRDTERDTRFAPIAATAQQVWKSLRRSSSVDLVELSLEGRSNRRTVRLGVSVDDEPADALSVMSQGELHALALALFVPRIQLEDSPFGFVVIDDPIQAMDPAKVDGLARVLEDLAGSRQVIVFTHDDRLFEAIRRLKIKADVREVRRAPGSKVSLGSALSPSLRYINDARRLASKENELGTAVVQRVIPGLCRMAIEAAFVSIIRRRHLQRGEPHHEVEQLIEGAHKLYDKATLALFDSPDRGSEVLTHLNNRFGSGAADVFVLANKGAHEGFSGDLISLMETARTLARGLEGQA